MLRKIFITKENYLKLAIPKEYLNKKIEILVFPIDKNSEKIEYWSKDELEELPTINLSKDISYSEDYSKW